MYIFDAYAHLYSDHSSKCSPSIIVVPLGRPIFYLTLKWSRPTKRS